MKETPSFILQRVGRLWGDILEVGVTPPPSCFLTPPVVSLGQRRDTMISKREYELLSKFKPGPVDQVGLDADEQRFFLNKWIEATGYNDESGLTACQWVITGPGESALEEFENEAKKRKDEKTNNIKSRRVQVIAAVIGALSTALFAFLFGHLGSLVKLLNS